MMSTGLPRDQLAGICASSRAMLSADSSASSTPVCAAQSAAITPAPPPLVRMTSFSPRLARKRASVSAARKSCCMVSTRSMPARAMAAS